MLYLVVSIVLSAALLVLFAPLKAIIRYAEGNLCFSIKLFGICIYNSKVKKKGEAEAETANNFEKKTNNVSLKLKDFIKVFKTAVILLKKLVRIKELKLNVVLGAGDAAVTAVSTGALWAAVYNLIGIIGRIVYIDKHKVEITPDYVNETFRAEGNCIITSRLVYIIIIMVTILMKIKIRRSKNE